MTSGFLTGDITEELVESFFEAEVEMERKICRDIVCTSHKDEEGKRTDVEVPDVNKCDLKYTAV